MKSSLKRLLRAHYSSYVNAANRRIRWQDHALFEGLPAIALAACLILETKLSTTASAALLTVSGLLGAFLFGVMLQVAESAMEWADTSPPPGRETSDHAIFLREISANAGYAAVVSITAAILFVVATVTTKTALQISSAVGLALGVHLVLVLFMVMNRVFALTENRLTRARTGSNVTTLGRQRDAS